MVTYLVPIIVTPYISRVFGPQGVGIQSYVFAVATYFVMFAMLGTSIYGTREIAQSRDDRQKCSLQFWEIFFLKVITTLLSLLAWGFFVFSTTQYKAFYLAASSQIIATIFDISWFFDGYEKMDVIAIRNVIIKILNLIFVFSVIKKAEDVWIYIFSVGVFTLFGNISLWFSLKKYLVSIHIQEINVFRHLRDSIIYFIPTFATLVYTVLDKVMIGIITKNEAENGFYEQAERIINIGKNLVCTLPNVMAARISYLFAIDDRKEIQRKVFFSIDFFWFMSLPITLGLIGISHSLIPWYFGEEFSQVEYLIYIMCWLVLIVGASAVLGRVYLTPSGQRARSSKAIIAGAICNFLLNIILIPRFASFGAAIASVVGELIVASIYLYMSKEFIKVNEFFILAWKKIISAVIMLLVITNNVWDAFFIAWRKTMMQVLVGAGVYMITLVVLRDDLAIKILRIAKNMLKKRNSYR